MALSAQSIAKLCMRGTKVNWIVKFGNYYKSFEDYWSQGMISPFLYGSLKIQGRSFGLAPASYDVRLAKTLWVWPFWGRLGYTLEYFRMPNDVAAEVKDKSTNARLFILVQNTWIDPGWEGYLTLEITRFKPWPVRLKAGTPIAQIVFNQLDEPTDLPYSGKYQKQPQHAVKPILEKA